MPVAWCHGRGLYRVTRYIIRRTCTRNRSDIAQPTTHAYSNESRWFSSHALEDSCYTHRDFARLMHSCTYPSRDSESVNTAGHGAATRHYWNHRVFPPSCRRSLHSFIFFPQPFIVFFSFFVRLRHVSHAVARARKFLISTGVHCPEIKMRPLR